MGVMNDGKVPVAGVDDAPVDVRSFGVFVAEVEPRLRRALVAGFGPVAGRDATAEALAVGWEKWEKVRVMDNPAGYLYRVGQNRARRAFRLVPSVLPPPSSEDIPHFEPGLPAALSKLSFRQRQVVVLVHGYGFTHAETADLLGISRSSVQSHTERGLQRLRTTLGVSDETR